MNKKTIGIISLVVGIIVLAFGISSMGSFASDISEALTGAPTDRAMWLLIAGVVLAITGAIFVSQNQ
ncbi:MAG: DUF3185 family protein [Candidatus Omnitrophica bacterium]|nr:DUF3185 family protein [Candidatus Omnitrophota bacterium]